MTKGEELLGRELLKETRAGIPHYVPGQHAARITERGSDSELVAKLQFVNVLGHAVEVVCERRIGEGWKAIAYAEAGHESVMGPNPAPKAFEFSERMLDHLRTAEERFAVER